MSNSPKVLFIGFDAGEPNVIDQMCEEGKLPALDAIRKNHLSGAMTSVVGFGNDVMWSSFNTCVNPAKHGQYFYRQFDPGTYECPIYHPPKDRPEAFWNALSRAKKRTAIIDVPYAPLSETINGMHVVEWLAHDRFINRWRGEAHGPDGHSDHNLPFTAPSDLAAELTSRFGIDRIGQRDKRGRGSSDWKHLRDDLIDSVNRKADMSCAYLQEADWDLFAVVFQDAHDAGHTLWHLHDTSNVEYDPDWVAEHGDPVEDIYVAIDRAISRVMECAGEDAVTIVFAGAGITNNYSANFIIDDVLQALEHGRRPARRRVDLLRSLWRMMPDSVRNKYRGVAVDSEQAMLVKDRKRRKYFALPHTEGSIPIRINVIGREANGVVKPGDEYDEVCETLMANLRELVNGDTGRPIVGEVFRTAKRYEGQFVELLPDIFAVWRQEAPLHRVISPKFGEIKCNYPGFRSGDHSTRCAFYACGPGIKPGRIDNAVSVCDFGPTIAARLGVTLPDWVDGKPVAEFGLSQN